MAKKYVINAGRIVQGEVDYHYQLVARTVMNTVGGLWHLDKDSNTIIYYGTSLDFGQPTKAQFDAAYNQYAERFNIFFTTAPTLKDALDEWRKQHTTI